MNWGRKKELSPKILKDFQNCKLGFLVLSKSYFALLTWTSPFSGWKKLIFVSGTSKLSNDFSLENKILDKRFVRPTSYFGRGSYFCTDRLSSIWQPDWRWSGARLSDLSCTAKTWNWPKFARSMCPENVPFCLFELWPLLLKAEKRLRCNACSEDFVGGILTRICGSGGASDLGSENFVNCILKECNFVKDSFVVQ